MTLFNRILVLPLILAAFPLFAQEKKPWTPPPAIELEKLIEANPSEAARVIRKSWGQQALTGKAYRLEKTTALWARIADKPVTVVRTDTGKAIGTMTKLDDSGLQALAVTLPNFHQFDYELRTGDQKLGSGNVKIEHYDYTSDSLVQEGVQQGAVHKHEWNDSKIYPGTQREYLVYIPAQYDGSKPAALMIFQDGLRHAAPDGPLRTTTVLDNLIAKGEMPVTIGLFINPGRMATQKPGEKPRNRSVEYDSLGDTYARFLIEEIIPAAVKDHDLKLSDAPEDWGIAGGSSGAACAWTVAWERPDKFRKVVSWVGTFVDIRGANAYPSLIRKTERKPIRAYLLDGENDLDNQYGNWPLANLQMDAALKFMGYDYHFQMGQCFHGSTHAGAILPEMLKWVWRE